MLNHSFEVKSIYDIAALYRETADGDAKEFHCGDKRNIACLVNLIGQDHLAKIFSDETEQMDLDEDRPLSRREIKNVFIKLLDLHEGSIIKRRELFCYSNLNELDALLLNEAPSVEMLYKDRAISSGKGAMGCAEIAYILGLHHLNILSGHLDAKQLFLSEVEMLTSRLADREMQVGKIMHLCGGYYKVDRIFVQGGAYVSALRNLACPWEIKLVCRGTAMRPTATDGLQSGLNDLLLEIGSKGIKEIWPALSVYLQEEEITRAEIFGKSLGGAHAQMLAVLIAGTTNTQVTKLATYCSVGVSNGVHTLFKEIRERSHAPMDVIVIRNGELLEENIDFVPALGGSHLGADVENINATVYYLHNHPGQESAVYTASLGAFAALKAFFKSFLGPHLLQPTLKEFTYTVLEGAEVHKQLHMGMVLEKMRLFIAYILHIVTLGFLNGESFDKFFRATQSATPARAATLIADLQ